MTDARRAPGTIRQDPNLLALREFTELVAASARSQRQKERLLRAARVALTTASLTALRLVERHGPIGVSDLARRLDVDQSTASRQLRPLEEHDLVQRATDPDDRRAAMLTISPAGRRLLERVADVMLNDFDVAMSDWSETDRTALATLIERLRVSLLQIRTDESGWSIRAARTARV